MLEIGTHFLPISFRSALRRQIWFPSNPLYYPLSTSYRRFNISLMPHAWDQFWLRRIELGSRAATKINSSPSGNPFRAPFTWRNNQRQLYSDSFSPYRHKTCVCRNETQFGPPISPPNHLYTFDVNLRELCMSSWVFPNIFILILLSVSTCQRLHRIRSVLLGVDTITAPYSFCSITILLSILILNLLIDDSFS